MRRNVWIFPSPVRKKLSLRSTIKKISLHLPRLGVSCLIICIISGIILAFYYRPMGNVFQNLEEITTLVPYGWFFRRLHYFSGQIFVILMLLHTVDHFLKKRYSTYPPGLWVLLVVSLCLCSFAPSIAIIEKRFCAHKSLGTTINP